jgi:plastocyanin
MKPLHIPVVLALALIFCLAIPSIVRAGGSDLPSASPSQAVLKGAVKFTGPVPAPKKISMSADPSCAQEHHGPVLDQPIRTDSKGGLEDVIVFISDGLSGQSFDAPTQPAVISQKGCQYEPHVLALRANQPLDVVNGDQTTHNIHPVPVNNREWNKAELPGAKVEEAFAREEVAIPVKCNIHPWMRGYIAVFKHPYFVVTKQDGAFTMPVLPPGTYKVTAWHEKLGTMTQTVTVGAHETKELSFEFKAM